MKAALKQLPLLLLVLAAIYLAARFGWEKGFAACQKDTSCGFDERPERLSVAESESITRSLSGTEDQPIDHYVTTAPPQYLFSYSNSDGVVQAIWIEHEHFCWETERGEWCVEGTYHY